jgi:phage terminase large subunit-like protein
VWVVLALLFVFAPPAATPRDRSRVSAVEYKPERCAYCQAETWCELRANKKWQCRGCKAVRYFQHYLYPPIGYQLTWWSEKATRDLFGTIDMETGLRQYLTAYISMGKQNGKSNWCGGLPIYHLDCEDEPDPEVYGAAGAKDQAGIVFKATDEADPRERRSDAAVQDPGLDEEDRAPRSARVV